MRKRERRERGERLRCEKKRDCVVRKRERRERGERLRCEKKRERREIALCFPKFL